MRLSVRLVLVPVGLLGVITLASEAGCIFTTADDCRKTAGSGTNCRDELGGGPTSTGTKQSSSSSSGSSASSSQSSSILDGGIDAPQDPVCTVPTDCPAAPAGECSGLGTPTCINGLCGIRYQAGPAKSTPYGTCTKYVCDDQGHATQANDPTNVFDDGNPCTLDICSNNVPVSLPVGTGDGGAPVSCGDAGFCQATIPTGSMFCSPCIEGQDCDNIDYSCMQGVCRPKTCKDGMRNGYETDLDCGGPCLPCDPGLACKAASDCASGVCSNKVCQAANCSDGIKNGPESDIDCGQSCTDRCAVGASCNRPLDCDSRVCLPVKNDAGVVIDHKCAAPTCTDGVRNGSPDAGGETGVDCGGATCLPCSW